MIVSNPVVGAPPPQDPIALFKACKEHLNARLADGTLDCVYVTPDGGGMSIVNVESNEELWEKTEAFPASPYLKHEFYPLLDHNYFYDKLVERLQEMASG